MIAQLQKLFSHNAWANRTDFDCVFPLVQGGMKGGSLDRALKRLNHIAGAERLWYERIHNHPASVAVWPELTLTALGEHLNELAELWKNYLEHLSEAELSRVVTYTNSKGEPWHSTVEDILLHVVLHSSYHRGQIASDIRDSGDEPPYTDYIHAIRSGKI